MRTHESYIKCGINAKDGIDLDMIGTNPSCKGIFGPITISNVVKLPAAFPLEAMHAICLGIFKNFNLLFFSSQNKEAAYYLGKWNIQA